MARRNSRRLDRAARSPPMLAHYEAAPRRGGYDMTDTSSLRAERLTQYSHGAGCACKLDPSRLARLVRGLVPSHPAELLVGPQTGDDAAEWKHDDERTLLGTADYITPVVDDARVWGRE